MPAARPRASTTAPCRCSASNATTISRQPAQRRGRFGRCAPPPRGRRRRRHGLRRARRRLAGVRREARRAPTVPARRHLHPAPDPHLTPLARSRAPAAATRLPRRELLGRLRHHRDPPAPAGTSRRRRPDRHAGARRDAAVSPLYGCSDVELWEWRRGGGTWNLWAPIPDRADRPSRRRRDRATSGRSPNGSGHVGSRSARGGRRRTPALRPGAGRPRRPRCLAPAALRDRTGQGLGRRRWARRSPVPAVGDDAGVGGPGRRHDPARARPRRGAGHDDPCRQGSRVPDHDRGRSHHQAQPRRHQRRGVGQRHLDARGTG